MNTIITFSIKKDQLVESMISTLITYCFHRTVYSQIFSILNRSIKKKDFYLPFKTNKEVLTAIGKTDKRTEQALTDIKKAGLLLKHNKKLVLHPLVYTRKSYGDRLENIIYYYYLLFGQNTFNKLNIPITLTNSVELDFKQVKLDAIREYKLSPSLQDKKEQIMLNELDDYFNGTNITPFLSDEELETHITANENSVYELYQSIFVDSTVPSHQRSLKRSTTQRYRSKLSSYARTLLELHIEIFSEQNLVKHNSGVEYDFYRITTKSQKHLIDYKKTSVYKKITSPVENKQELDLFKNARPVYEIMEEIKQQEKLTAPVNITNEINPIEDKSQEFTSNEMATKYIQEQLKNSNFAYTDLEISYDRPQPNNPPEESDKWYGGREFDNSITDREIFERQALSLHNEILKLKRAINTPPTEQIFDGLISKSDKCDALEQYNSSIQSKDKTLKRKEELLKEMFETYAVPNYNHTINSIQSWIAYLEKQYNISLHSVV